MHFHLCRALDSRPLSSNSSSSLRNQKLLPTRGSAAAALKFARIFDQGALFRRCAAMSNEDVVAAARADERSLVYDALDASKRQVRLLHVGFGRTQDHRPSYGLHTFDIEDAPKYRALSYAWSDPNPLHTFHMGDASLLIRQNLYSFLNTYDRPGYIWIDQVCINQKDKVERNHQVGMMAGVYNKCQQVIVWLGSDTPEARQAVHQWSRSNLSWLPEELKADVYFTCLWIVQEVLLAKHIDFLCRGTTGSVYIPWNTLERSLMGDAADRRFMVLTDHILLRNRKLVKLLEYLSTFQCCEPRDRIYAKQRIVKEKDRVPVDYTRPVHLVFSYRDQFLKSGIIPHVPILLDLAKTIGLGIKGTGTVRFLRFLGALFGQSIVRGVQDIGVHVTISELSENETVTAWWYETAAGRVEFSHRGRATQGSSTA